MRSILAMAPTGRSGEAMSAEPSEGRNGSRSAQRSDPSDTVTRSIDYANNELWLGKRGDGKDYKHAPRWIRAEVTALIDDGRIEVSIFGNAPRTVRLARCDCGDVFAFDGGFHRHPPGRCRACERAHRTNQQRALRHYWLDRELRQACAVCGGALAPQRRTRSYCSDACRQRAQRNRARKLAG
jgi:hypothetical protein